MELPFGGGGSGETKDSICGVEVLQPARGYRFNLDSVLLAHFAGRSGRVGPTMDLGTGSGVIPLILAGKLGYPEVMGLEVQPRLFELARRSVQLNRLERRISLVLGDIREVAGRFGRTAFSMVISNPPYRAPTSGSRSPSSERALARHELACTLGDVAEAAAYLLAPRGSFSLVYPASRLGEAIEALRSRRLEPRRLRVVFSRADRPASRILLEAVKGGSAPLSVLPPLIVHPGPGAAVSEEVRQMLLSPPHQGDARRAALGGPARLMESQGAREAGTTAPSRAGAGAAATPARASRQAEG